MIKWWWCFQVDARKIPLRNQWSHETRRAGARGNACVLSRSRSGTAHAGRSLWRAALCEREADQRESRDEPGARSRKCRGARTHADYGGKTRTGGSFAFKQTRSFDFCSRPLRTNRWVSSPFTLFRDFRGNTEVAAALPFIINHRYSRIYWFSLNEISNSKHCYILN